MKILIASSICPDAIAQLRAHHDVTCAFGASRETLQSLIADREILIFRSGVEITKDVMSCAPQLQLLIRAGSGLDNLDTEYVCQRALKLVRIPGPGAQAVAELAFGLMITLAREIRLNDNHLRQGHWTKQQTKGYVLRGKVLGIVGAGNIGSRVGQLGTAWGMEVVGCIENPTATDAAALSEQGIRLSDFNNVVEAADFLSIHVPKQPSTLNLIDVQALSRMKRSSFLINMARGGIVDELALLQALLTGQIAGAALDVHAAEGEGKISPLAQLSNVVLTPHIGATTVDTLREIGERITETVSSFVEGRVNGTKIDINETGSDGQQVKSTHASLNRHL